MSKLLYKENGRYVYYTPWGEYMLKEMTYSQKKAVGFSLLCVIIMLSIALATKPMVI